MKLSHVFGINPEDAARLEQANVHTLRDLAAVPDLAALSASTNISLDFLERWRAAAAARIRARKHQGTLIGVLALVTAVLVSGIAIWSHNKGISPALDQAIDEFNRGNALSNEGKFDDAIAAYRRAVAIKPDYAEAQYNLGVALREKGDFEAAAAEYRKALADHPNDPSSHNGLGNVYLAAGNVDGAIAELEKAVALAPTYTYAWHDLALALKDKYLREKPPNVATLRQLSDVLDKLLELQKNPAAQQLPPANLKSMEQLWEWTRTEMTRLHVHYEPDLPAALAVACYASARRVATKARTGSGSQGRKSHSLRYFLSFDVNYLLFT